MKINAAARLAVASARSLKDLIGLEGTLITLTRTSGLYKLVDRVETVVPLLTKRFGKPTIGRKGEATLYVWRPNGLDVVLEHNGTDLTLEISE